ncbi:Mov34/MPN/PAD-1 family protein [Sphingorhabdus arenilitoris]|uniref:Mov34/MPN/PAD-1 family protein n=1 Tax=Sphingorhabdus arenilitoris TaxID=1490041 RepID=A0ABV8RGW7_9SPHN
MALFLSSQHRTQLTDFARGAYPYECCGLLLGDGQQVLRLLPAKNVASDTRCNFEIDPAVLLSVQKAQRQGGLSLLGYYHSHPNGKAGPSMTDAKMASADGKYWLIIAQDEVTAWSASHKGKLFGRFDEVEIIFQG